MQVYLYGDAGTVYDDVQISQVTPAPAAARSMTMMAAREAVPETEAAPQPVPEPGTLRCSASALPGLSVYGAMFAAVRNSFF